MINSIPGDGNSAQFPTLQVCQYPLENLTAVEEHLSYQNK